MPDQTVPVRLAEGLPRSPFERLRALIAGVAPGAAPIDLSIGAPRHPFPKVVGEIIARELAGFGRYPPAHANTDFGAATADWLTARFGLASRPDPARHILPLAGSREGLFTIAFLAADAARGRGIAEPLFAMPNPFYQVYAAAALASGCRPICLETTPATGNLPDLDALRPDDLSRLAAFYICSPANPQGAIASAAYLARLAGLARRHGFLVLSDECYSEIYRRDPPPGILAASDNPDFTGLLAFNSLSKRSNLPGLRVGFVAGDAGVIDAFFRFRNVAAASVPIPAMAVGATLLRDEAHVAENRRLYNEKFALAEEILAPRFGPTTPPGGFFVWLDVSASGGSEAAALALWREAGVKVVPGAYLAATGPDGANPGADYLRIALVGDNAEIVEAMTRVLAVLAH